MRAITLGLVASVPFALSVAVTAQGPITAQLIAVAPIECEWLNAPPGTPGALVSHPAGPLTLVTVDGPAGTNWAHFHCALDHSGDDWSVTSTSQVFSPLPEIAEARADLLLSLTATAPTTTAIEINLQHYGDTVRSTGFRVDVDDDGTDDLTTSSPYCCGSVLHLSLTRTIDIAPTVIRVRSNNAMSFSPQGYDLRIDVQPWLAAATPVSGECVATAIRNPLQSYFYRGNYQLAALPSSMPTEFGVLRARGLGDFDFFLIGGLPTTAPLTLPAPIPGPCDVMTDLQIVVPGSPTVMLPGRVEWELRIPALPPGLVFHAQHASVHTIFPFAFGTTNVLRLDT